MEYGRDTLKENKIPSLGCQPEGSECLHSFCRTGSCLVTVPEIVRPLTPPHQQALSNPCSRSSHLPALQVAQPRLHLEPCRLPTYRQFPTHAQPCPTLPHRSKPCRLPTYRPSPTLTLDLPIFQPSGSRLLHHPEAFPNAL